MSASFDGPGGRDPGFIPAFLSLTASDGRVLLPQDVLGYTFRELRARRALSQTDLGDASTLHRNYVGAMERGEINATFVTLLKMAHGLNVPFWEVATLYDERWRELLNGATPPPRPKPRGPGAGRSRR
jgi:DNA-binding XRE family transcriptional regulator